MWRLVLLLAVLFAAPTAVVSQDTAGQLQIHFLDVGQGDAVVIRAPTGQHVVIDAGPDDSIVNQLIRLEVDTVALFIASHNHADHIGGAVALLRNFPVRLFMDNGVPHTTLTYRNLLETLSALAVPLLEPERRVIGLGEAVLEILPPIGDPALGHNDNSIGVLLRFGEFRASFTGDAEARLWRYWLDEMPEALSSVHVHKASHHGSRAGDTAEALAFLRPELVVVSAGRENPFGHPHQEAMALYRSVGATTLITAEHGTITVRARASGLFDVLTERLVADRVVECVDLNRASLVQLQEIIHIGPERAEQIVAWRERQPFSSVDQLARVDGIGPARLAAIRVQGLVCAR
jgi:competence protein ComEC